MRAVAIPVEQIRCEKDSDALRQQTHAPGKLCRGRQEILKKLKEVSKGGKDRLITIRDRYGCLAIYSVGYSLPARAKQELKSVEPLRRFACIASIGVDSTRASS